MPIRTPLAHFRKKNPVEQVTEEIYESCDSSAADEITPLLERPVANKRTSLDGGSVRSSLEFDLCRGRNSIGLSGGPVTSLIAPNAAQMKTPQMNSPRFGTPSAYSSETSPILPAGRLSFAPVNMDCPLKPRSSLVDKFAGQIRADFSDDTRTVFTTDQDSPSDKHRPDNYREPTEGLLAATTECSSPPTKNFANTLFGQDPIMHGLLSARRSKDAVTNKGGQIRRGITTRGAADTLRTSKETTQSSKRHVGVAQPTKEPNCRPATARPASSRSATARPTKDIVKVNHPPSRFLPKQNRTAAKTKAAPQSRPTTAPSRTDAHLDSSQSLPASQPLITNRSCGPPPANRATDNRPLDWPQTLETKKKKILLRSNDKAPVRGPRNHADRDSSGGPGSGAIGRKDGQERNILSYVDEMVSDVLRRTTKPRHTASGSLTARIPTVTRERALLASSVSLPVRELSASQPAEYFTDSESGQALRFSFGRPSLHLESDPKHSLSSPPSAILAVNSTHDDGASNDEEPNKVMDVIGSENAVQTNATVPGDSSEESEGLSARGMIDSVRGVTPRGNELCADDREWSTPFRETSKALDLRSGRSGRRDDVSPEGWSDRDLCLIDCDLSRPTTPFRPTPVPASSRDRTPSRVPLPTPKAGMSDTGTPTVSPQLEDVYQGDSPEVDDAGGIIDEPTTSPEEHDEMSSDEDRKKKVKRKITSRNRDRLASLWYEKFNEAVFDNKLPRDLEILWNPRFTKSAGRTAFQVHDQDVTSSSGLAGGSQHKVCDQFDGDENEGVRDTVDLHTGADNDSLFNSTELLFPIKIELSTKLVTTLERLQRTLLHEMCHVAQVCLDGKDRGKAHGPVFKKWVSEAARRYPSVPVSIQHSYTLECSQHRWLCQQCNRCHQRETKTINVKKHVCGCGGMLRYVGKFDSDNKRVSVKKCNAYQTFCKDNYNRLLAIHKDPKLTMKKLGTEWQQHKETLASQASGFLD